MGMTGMGLAGRTVSVGVPQGAAAEGGTGLAGWILARVRLARVRVTRGRGRSGRRMELVETLELGGRRQLLLVECEGRRYLVGAGGDSVQSIAEMGGRGVGVSVEELRCCP
ncbi:MAG: flagellar biosynthetic protein FliO [Acidobacteriaceae bacterium]